MTSVSRLTIGLDLGDTTSDVCVLDPHQREVERRPLATTRESLTALFDRYPGSTVVFEVGSQSRWVQQLARERGASKVIAANPRQLKLISQSRSKGDRKDAYLLCRAGQGLPELLHPVEHRSEPVHIDLLTMRVHDHLVAQRTEIVNMIRSMVKTTGSKLPKCDAQGFHVKARPQIPESLREVCEPLFSVLEKLHEELRRLARQRKALMNKYPIAKLLSTIPSVGEITVLTFVLTVEDPRRIHDTRNIGAYFGIVPRRKESGDSSPQLGITKAGDTRMRRLLVLCAQHLLARGKDCMLKRWGLALCQRGGRNAKKRAVVAVARKLAVHMLAIWKSGEAYDCWRGAPADLIPTEAT